MQAPVQKSKLIDSHKINWTIFKDEKMRYILLFVSFGFGGGCFVEGRSVWLPLEAEGTRPSKVLTETL